MQPQTSRKNTRAGLGQKLLAIPRFYANGFRNMTVGRSLWLVITIKMIVLFGVLKLFFFPDFLETRFDNNADRSNYVLEQITVQPTDVVPTAGEEAHD